MDTNTRLEYYFNGKRMSGNFLRITQPGVAIQKLAFIGGQIPCRIAVRYLSILTKKGPYTNLYLCKHVGIWANLNQARNRDWCNHDFGFSISSFDLTYVPVVWKSL